MPDSFDNLLVVYSIRSSLYKEYKLLRNVKVNIAGQISEQKQKTYIICIIKN